jgi:D-alanyl-D-alanine carboxypeptidase/D-alanyl-D-alanine-endopeptidase (penicillin-binding protein 4)
LGLLSGLTFLNNKEGGRKKAHVARFSLVKCVAGVLYMTSAAAWTLIIAVCPPLAAESPGNAPCIEHITNGAYLLGDAETPVSSYNEDDLFIPASTLKIVTALVALETLGPEYRFSTAYYIDEDNRLTIRGFGDPWLISEVIAEHGRQLRLRGITHINEIIIDDSAFRLEFPQNWQHRSDNPYDAENGAINVNFNTAAIRKFADGRVLSAESQTPTVAILKTLGRGVAVGYHRINVSAADAGGNNLRLRYAGEIFAALFRQAGITVAGAISIRSTAPRGRLIYTAHTPIPLSEVLRACLTYSNNMIANQIFLVCGAERYGYPANWEKGRRAAATILQDLAPRAKSLIHIEEGSGLSQANQVTADAMVEILALFKPYADLLPEQDGILVKSGTLSGVYNYAGYLKAEHHLDPFVILLNQRSNKRDELLSCLLHYAGLRTVERRQSP